MAIYEPDVPAEILRESLAGLDNYLLKGDAERQALVAACSPQNPFRVRAHVRVPGEDDPQQEGSQRQLRIAHLVFNLDMETIAGATSLESVARQAGWRFLTEADGRAVASYVSLYPNSAAAVTNVQHGARLAAVLQIARDAEQRLHSAIPESAAENFSVSVVCAPSIYVEALWIRPDPPGQEYVIPVRAIAGALEVGTVLTAEEFLAECKTLSARKLAAIQASRHQAP